MAPGSRWRKLPTIATWALAPVLFAQAYYHLRGEADAGSLACWVLAVIPPLAATGAGVFVFARREAVLVVAGFCGALLAYLLPSGWWFLRQPLLDSNAVLAFYVFYGIIVWPAAVLAAFAGGALVGSKIAAGTYHLLRPRVTDRGVCSHSPLGTAGVVCLGRSSRVEKGVQWLGAAAGTAAWVSPLWFSNLPDIILGIVFPPLMLGAWLSAAFVVLVLGPKSAARDEPGDSPAGGGEPS